MARRNRPDAHQRRLRLAGCGSEELGERALRSGDYKTRGYAFAQHKGNWYGGLAGDQRTHFFPAN